MSTGWTGDWQAAEDTTVIVRELTQRLSSSPLISRTIAKHVNATAMARTAVAVIERDSGRELVGFPHT